MCKMIKSLEFECFILRTNRDGEPLLKLIRVVWRPLKINAYDTWEFLSETKVTIFAQVHVMGPFSQVLQYAARATVCFYALNPFG